MASYDQAKPVFDQFKSAFEAQPCDLPKCATLLNQLKVLVFGFKSGGDADKERQLTRETLELACFLSIRQEDLSSFERHVAQLKMSYQDSKQPAAQNSQYIVILGLYLLHLLAADRIGEFHTELELITTEEQESTYIKQPVQLERYVMEGNYGKILEAQKDVPQMYYPYFMKKLVETVRAKVGASLERSYEHLPAEVAAKFLILDGIPKLQEFCIKENERKAREESDDPMAGIGAETPSLSRRHYRAGLIKWQVKDGTLHFNRSEEKQLEIPALELMVNTIGYATDLERIV